MLEMGAMVIAMSMAHKHGNGSTPVIWTLAHSHVAHASSHVECLLINGHQDGSTVSSSCLGLPSLGDRPTAQTPDSDESIHV